MSAHTPGPWEWQGHSKYSDMPALITADGSEICHFGDKTRYYPEEGVPPNEANARLIAAAPDLLEALDLVASLASQEWQEADGARKGAVDNAGNRQWFINASVMQEVRAAIAKATGGAA